MCGVIGFVALPSNQDIIRAGRFQPALDSLRHRGPDRQGQYREGNVWLGHTRLSILDLSTSANQPMRTSDQRFAISYNGEVYNFRELTKEYGLDNLRSGSDTEVVLRLFADGGVESLAKLNGMFAFAVHDARSRKLWLVRDRFGIKPLYYQKTAESFAFASEIKGIIALTQSTLRCNVAALHEWLYYGNPLGGRTLYDGIEQLLPGHYLELELDTLKYVVREYWSLRERVRGRAEMSAGGQDVVSETRQLLEQSVRRQLVSDVPVGVFLSGGVDSSAIAAFGSRHYEGRLSTYSAGFDYDRDGGELPKARRIAALFGTEHHEIHIRGGDVHDVVEKMVFHHDMPFSDAANIPLYLLASQISGQTKVVLQGDGGDELFGGYRRYSTLSYYRLLHFVAGALGRLNVLMPRPALRYRLRRYLNAFDAEDIATTIALLLSNEDRSCAPVAIFAPRWREAIARFDPFARYRECHAMFRDCDIGNQMSFIDMMIVLPDTFLPKVDRSTMAASLEVRVPFLDHDLVDFVAGLPGRKKFPGGKKKWLLKAALHGIVPDDVLYGPKTGLSVPFGQWLKGSLKSFFFDHLSKFERDHPDVLDLDYIGTLYARTSAGSQDHAGTLWKVLNLLVWANNSDVEIADSGAR